MCIYPKKLQFAAYGQFDLVKILFKLILLNFFLLRTETHEAKPKLLSICKYLQLRPP